MNKTYNIYCDESCHIEHDHKDYMFLGSISCAYPQVRQHTKCIDELKKLHNFYAEIKWSNVSMSKIRFYLDLVDYFFDTDLRFRAIGIILPDNRLCFSVAEPRNVRTYIYDVDEKYVIVLEPLRNGTAYYLLTAYPLEGKDAARNKIMNKYKRRRLPNLL